MLKCYNCYKNLNYARHATKCNKQVSDALRIHSRSNIIMILVLNNWATSTLAIIMLNDMISQWYDYDSVHPTTFISLAKTSFSRVFLFTLLMSLRGMASRIRRTVGMWYGGMRSLAQAVRSIRVRFVLGRSTTIAATFWPQVRSGSPTTTASAMLGCERRWRSMSSALIL